MFFISFLTATVGIVSTFVAFAPFFQAQAAPVTSSSTHVSRDASDLDITQYLIAHNSIRAVHGASPLTWSEDLAAGAQTWANACNFQHSDGLLSQMPYGENLAAATGGNFGIDEAVESFMGDEDSYDPSSPTFSDFTQIVWKNTTIVGCAYNTQCGNIFPTSSGMATLHVCLYNPPGNVVGQASENVQV
ncbi:CAP domain-containing protein [Lentinula raphanica]|uniref:CAP domain-containing protein n=1 Tax=Lentinula raphanica TaxID=153919 RepID=A0AA38PEX6_9AGAR|nr:CAP domain-containing protein [Lentinula raphanica]KAJ3841405.1 CAP domain-containing protein [Lentinula raphanica]